MPKMVLAFDINQKHPEYNFVNPQQRPFKVSQLSFTNVQSTNIEINAQQS